VATRLRIVYALNSYQKFIAVKHSFHQPIMCALSEQSDNAGRDAALLTKGVHMPTRLLFSNVPFDCSDDLLKQWIEDHGYPVLNVKVIRDLVTGTSPSFAHVQLVNATKLDEAERTLNDQPFRGCTLRVSRVVRINAAARTRSAGMSL
jgi:RNA recognition motif